MQMRRNMFGIGLLVLAGLSTGWAQDAQELEEDQNVISAFVTPHTDWAIPYALGRTRVLCFVKRSATPVNYLLPREIVELEQRFDFDEQMVIWNDDDFNPTGWHGGVNGIDRMARLLGQTWAAFLFMGVPPENLPADQQTIVANAVNAGAGLILVGVDSPLLQDPITPVPAWLTNASTGVAIGAPYTVGQGRGIRLPAVPNFSSGYRPGWEVDYDHWQQGEGRAILWAAGKDPRVSLTVVRHVAEVLRTVLPTNEVTVTWQLPAQVTSLDLTATLRRSDGWTLAFLPTNVTAGVGSVDIEIPVVRGGDYHLDVVARSAYGIENFGTADFTVTSPRQVTSLALDQTWGEIGSNLTGSVTCTGIVSGASERLLVSLLDRRGRELERQDAGHVTTAGNFNFVIQDWMPMLVTVRAMLVSTGAVERIDPATEISSAWAFANITQRRRGNFNFLMWGYSSGHLEPYSLASLAKNNVTVIGGVMGDPPIYAAAYNIAWMPYTTWIDTEVNWPFCWNDESQIQPCVNSIVTNRLLSRQHGVFVYSLGDEIKVRGSCLRDDCQTAYQNYLQQQYGSISALNTAWNTNYSNFSSVVCSDNDEANALATGNYPRWFDRQAYQSYNFCNLCTRFGNAFHALDPQSKCGFEGAGGFAATGGDDLDGFVRANTFWSPYPGTADEVIRSIAPRDFPHGNWMGYTKDADSLLQAYWRMIVLGCDSVWFWACHNIGPYHGWLAPSLDPFPAVKEIIADTQVLRDGLDDLLLRCDMQTDGVGILFSQPSSYAALIQSSPSYCGECGYENDHLAWHSALRELGLNFRYITDRQLRLGEVNLSQYKVVILPFTEAIGTNEVQQLRSYVNNGGVLIADVRPGTYDGHVAPRTAGSLDDVFGVTRTSCGNAVSKDAVFSGSLGGIALTATVPGVAVDPGITANGAQAYGSAGSTPVLLKNNFGSGTAFLLNFAMVTYPQLSAPSTPEAVADVIKALMNVAQVTPRLSLQNSVGARMRNTQVMRWQDGATELVSIFRPSGTAESAHVVLTNSVWVYDLKNHQDMGGQQTSFDIQITPSRAQLFAFATQALAGAAVSVPNPVATPGTALTANVSVATLNVQSALKVQVRRPDGQVADWLDQILVTNSVGAAFKLPLAYNDPVGTWTITATELFTGQAVTTNVTVQSSAPVGNAPPTVAVAAAADQNPVTGTTANLSVLGADDNGEQNLTYTWAVTGTPPAPVDFLVNGCYEARHTLATFRKQGNYTLQVTIRDAGGLVITSSVPLNVNATFALGITPADICFEVGDMRTYRATVLDQFGAETIMPPGTFTWSVTGGGTMDSGSGRFIATTLGGPYTVTASGVGLLGMTSVTVADLTAGLVGWWKFDGNALDSSGMGNNGTPYGNVTYVQGIEGRAASFDPSSYVDCGNSASLSFTNELTIVFWMNATDYVDGYAYHPIQKWTGIQDANYVLYFFGPSTGNVLEFLANAGGNWCWVSAVFHPDLDTWYHVAWTYRASSGGRLYINGQPLGDTGGLGMLATNQGHLTLGAFSGLLRDMRIYNRALSAPEVVALASTNLPPLVTIANPVDNAVITTNSVTISANATDDDGTIARVDFYSGTTRLSNTNWLDGYTLRQPLMVTNLDAIGSAQTNFPLLVKLTAANFNFAAARPDGCDLRFTAGDGLTPLSFERERHDAVNRVAEYWVKLPVLATNGSAINVYVYYGSLPNVGNGANPTNVWDPNYLFVHHLGQAVGGCAWDSTMNAVMGTINNVALNESGYVDGGGQFLGFAAGMDLASFPVPTNATFESWLNTDSIETGTVEAGYAVYVDQNGKVESLVTTSAGPITNISAKALATGTWHYVVDVYGSQGRRLYVDGALDSMKADMGFPTSTFAIVGSEFSGLLDEVRLSKTVRSADWIEAQYASMGDRLLQYGTAEQPTNTSLVWSNVAPGTYSLTAVVWDNGGVCTTSAVVNLTVNDVPATRLTAPANGAVYTAPANVTLTATVSDVVGTITNVSFYTNGAFWSTGSLGMAGTYTNAWVNPPLGTNVVMARAYDSYGAAGTSLLVTNIVNDMPLTTLSVPMNGAAYLMPASITWTVTVANTIGTITNVSFYTNGAFCATGRAVSATVFTNLWKPGAGRYALTAKAWDEYDAEGASLTHTILVWTNQHIGANTGDSAPTYSAPQYTVNGKGAGITGTADAFRFLYLPMTGNCTIVARVTNFTSTAANTRAGVMMRASTNANGIEASSSFMRQYNRVYFHQRTATGGSTTTSYAAAAAPPYWVKLVRTNNVMRAFRSANGTSWTQVGANTTVTMSDPILVGLAVTSGSTSGIVTGIFDNVSVTAP